MHNTSHVDHLDCKLSPEEQRFLEKYTELEIELSHMRMKMAGSAADEDIAAIAIKHGLVACKMFEHCDGQDIADKLREALEETYGRLP